MSAVDSMVADDVSVRPAVATGGGRWITTLGWLALVSLVVCQIIAIRISVPERDMGNLQKILYVHVPAAWNAMIAIFVVFMASVLYLWKEETRYDLVAAAAGEVGAVMTGLTLMLGSIWGRPTWGVWWAWEPRLTSTAVLFLIFVGYLALRSFVDDYERRAKWSAAVGILGALNVPIVYMSVRWWRTLHQIQSSPSTVDPAYVIGLRINAIALMLVVIFFIARRYQAARLERAAELLSERVAMAAGGSHE